MDGRMDGWLDIRTRSGEPKQGQPLLGSAKIPKNILMIKSFHLQETMRTNANKEEKKLDEKLFVVKKW